MKNSLPAGKRRTFESTIWARAEDGMGDWLSGEKIRAEARDIEDLRSRLNVKATAVVDGKPGEEIPMRILMVSREIREQLDLKL